MKPTSALLCLLSVLCLGPAAQSQSPAARSTQMITVTTADWNAVAGHLQRYERTSPKAPWRPIGSSYAIVVGKHGLGWGLGILPTTDPKLRAASDPTKQEGDGKAPAGIFALGTTFGYAPQFTPGSKMPYLALTPTTECVDDIASKQYNRLVDRTALTPDWNSSEHMRSAGESYRWGIVVDHNATVPAADSNAHPTPGSGSCIFLHIWQGAGKGTVGCTAMPQSELEALITWLDPKRHPVLVQLPVQQYAALLQRWKLPTIINTPTP
jgi:D-alanyl-D-alanine dipeptidase